MPSLLPGYEYDIFVSYRQKDNLSSAGSLGWVTGFVDTLKNELEGTFKEPVSVYFDANPHDGLHDTHDVNDSLKEKVKCLVFIPIVSRTYCDPKSFAWSKEFLPFLEFAKDDGPGLKVTLPNGNVSSRVLPVRIHDLDKTDADLFERETGGMMRSVDFIFSETGINRPLHPEDGRQKYRNQINKLAMAAKEIIHSLQYPEYPTHEYTPEERQVYIDHSRKETKKRKLKNVFALAAILALVTALVLYLFLPRKSAEETVVIDEDMARTIAIMPFDYQSAGGDMDWLADGLPREVLNALSRVNGLEVTGKSSSFSFKGKNATLKEIGEALNVNYIVDGSVTIVENKTRITVQLNEAATEKLLWSERFDRENSDIMSIIDEVTGQVVRSLVSEISIGELAGFAANRPKSDEAYEYYLRGMETHWDKYVESRDTMDMQASEKMFLRALDIEPDNAEIWAGLADLYDTRSWEDPSYDFKRDSIVDIGYALNPNSAYVNTTKGLKFRKQKTMDLDSAFYFAEKALQIEPKNTLFLILIMDLQRISGLLSESISTSNYILRLDPLHNYTSYCLAETRLVLEGYNATLPWIERNLELDISSRGMYMFLLENELFAERDFNSAKDLLQKVQNIYSDYYTEAIASALDGEKTRAVQLSEKELLFKTQATIGTYSILETKKEAIQWIRNNNQDYLNLLSFPQLNSHPRYNFIRDEPEFQEILKEAKAVYEERKEKYGKLFEHLRE